MFGCTVTSGPEITFNWYVINKSSYSVEIKTYFIDKTKANPQFVLDPSKSRFLNVGDSLFKINDSFIPFLAENK